MLVFGKNVLNEIDTKRIKKAFISNKDYIGLLKNKNIKYEVVDKRRLDNMVSGNHQQIVLDIFEYDYYNLNEVEGDLVVVLDHLVDPHNFGAIIRTCECAGVSSIIIPKDRSVNINDTVIKVSCGAIENVKIIMVTNISNALKKLKEMNYFVYAADMSGKDYNTVSYASKKVLIIGNEGNGISGLVLRNSDEIIKIPMYGTINSLNASVSAGILIYGLRGSNGN